NLLTGDDLPVAAKGTEINKLIYELVQDNQKEAIQNEFETTALKVATLKSKLDMKIDQTIIMLQNLKNLRRHIEKAYKFANKFVNSQVTNGESKRYVLQELENSIQQVEEALNYKVKSMAPVNA